MVNYYSSSSAITANFESASGSFGSSDGYAYQSAMSGYNGSGFGVERGVVNQTIPPTIDGQPLGEIDPDIFKNLIDATINSEIKKIVSTFDQYKILNYYKDERGNVRMVTKIDTSDDIVIKWEGDYSAYGMLLTGDIENLWLPLKTYALHEHDIVSGLVYAQARWYDPETGSFISEDPIKDGNNYYAYCGGNPIGMVDPTGLYGEHKGWDTANTDSPYYNSYMAWAASQGDRFNSNTGQLMSDDEYRLYREGAATSHGNDSLDELRSMADDRLQSMSPWQNDSRWYTGDSGSNEGNGGGPGIDYSFLALKNIDPSAYNAILKEFKQDIGRDLSYNFPLQTDEYLNFLAQNGEIEGLSDPYSNACLFMSYLRHVVNKTGQPLNAQDIIDIAIKAYKQDSPNIIGYKTLEPNYYVRDGFNLINIADDKLNFIRTTIEDADFSIIKYNTLKNNIIEGTHFTSGDRFGRQFYDPDPSLKIIYKLKIVERRYYKWE